MNYPDYGKYRKVQMEAGNRFADYVVDVAWQNGVVIVPYSSKLYQYKVGESRTHDEIKYDQYFAQTGNLWIEVAEKAFPRDGDYVSSGIYRPNDKAYLIGNYDVIFCFAKTHLRAFHASGWYPTIENRTKTSLGFLLPGTDAERFAHRIFRPNGAADVPMLTRDLEQLGRELHQLLISFKPGQNRLF